MADIKTLCHEAKRCTRCGESKPFSAFARHPKTRDGLNSHCRSCGLEYTREARNRDPETFRARGRAKHARTVLTEAQLDKRRESRRRYEARYPLKRQAHAAVREAIRTGRLTKMPCERCGSDKTHAHHDDYARPLEVIWLCPLHHSERHRELEAQWKTVSL